MEILVLKDTFEVIAEIDNYISLMWCRRAHDIGAVDLEIEASTKNVELFQIGYFIYRKDTNDICRIDAIEMKTDPEAGDKLIIGATDLKSLASQVPVIGEYKTEITQSGESNIIVENNVKVEEWIREATKVFTPYDSTVLPKSIYKQFVIDNFSLYDLKGYENMCILAEGKDLKLSEHINHLCKMSGMRWEITYDYDNKKLKLNLEKGLDKTVNQDENTRVLFSRTFDNLQTTKLSQAIDKMANVAAVYHNNASIVGDNGVIFSYLTREEPYGLYRFEIPIDGTKVEIPHLQTNADFIKVATGEGDYKKNNDGTFTKGKGDYNYVPQYTIDEIKSYAEILKGLGLAKLRENRVTQKFESEINLNQFVYRDDYDVADIITVQNEYGIQLDAKITEIVETWDETGYSIEPVFEFIGEGGNFRGFAGFGNFENTENDWDLTDSLITEDGYPMMTETDNAYLMYEDAYSISMLATETGIALTNENGVILEPTSLTRSFAMPRSSGSEPVTTALYDVSPTEIDIETVKISELPEAEGIGDACCLPIVQDGETKKIYFDKIKENIGIDEDAVQTIVNNSIKTKANYGYTSMVDLGFTKDSTVSVRDFWDKLYSKYGTNGVIQFTWSYAQAAKIGSSSNYATINGGTLIYTASSIPTAWQNFCAIYIDNSANGGIYRIRCSFEGDTSTGAEKWSIDKLANSSDLNSYATKSDISYKANYDYTTMVDLGFTKDSTVSVRDFWNELYSEYGNNGVIGFPVNYSMCANVGRSSVSINGGTLIYTCSGNASAWQNFSAIYYSSSGVYNIRCSFEGDTSTGAEKWEIYKLGKDSHSHDNKANYGYTSMVDLGFTKDSTVSVRNFWNKLYSKYGTNGVVGFPLNYSMCANVGRSSVSINGGTLVYTCSGDASAWQNFSAIYFNNNISSGGVYHIRCSFEGDTSTGAEKWEITDIASAMLKSSINTMAPGSSIDFNTNKATIQLPIYAVNATNQPTAEGAMWLQEVKESE